MAARSCAGTWKQSLRWWLTLVNLGCRRCWFPSWLSFWRHFDNQRNVNSARGGRTLKLLKTESWAWSNVNASCTVFACVESTKSFVRDVCVIYTCLTACSIVWMFACAVVVVDVEWRKCVKLQFFREREGASSRKCQINWSRFESLEVQVTTTYRYRFLKYNCKSESTVSMIHAQIMQKQSNNSSISWLEYNLNSCANKIQTQVHVIDEMTSSSVR